MRFRTGVTHEEEKRRERWHPKDRRAATEPNRLEESRQEVMGRGQAERRREGRMARSIIMISKDNCPQCAKLERYLKAHGAAFEIRKIREGNAQDLADLRIIDRQRP